MLKQDVKYINYDGEEATKTLWFHVTRSKLIENMELETELTEISSWFEGGKERDLTPEEIRRVLNVVKKIIEMSYGERNGDEFDDSPELHAKFKRTAVYEAFLWSLFEDPRRANDFMQGVLPPDMVAAAKEEAKKRGLTLPE